MIGLIVLGFGLSLDNFRTSVVLGGLKPTLLQSTRTSAIFGLWDGVAPVIGMLVGAYLSTRISDTAEMIAAVGLAGYSPWLAPILFAFTTFVMSVAGHQIGRSIAHFVPRLRTDLLTGVAFVLMAGMVVAGVGDF